MNFRPTCVAAGSLFLLPASAHGAQAVALHLPVHLHRPLTAHSGLPVGRRAPEAIRSAPSSFSPSVAHRSTATSVTICRPDPRPEPQRNWATASGSPGVVSSAQRRRHPPRLTSPISPRLTSPTSPRLTSPTLPRPHRSPACPSRDPSRNLKARAPRASCREAGGSLGRAARRAWCGRCRPSTSAGESRDEPSAASLLLPQQFRV